MTSLEPAGPAPLWAITDDLDKPVDREDREDHDVEPDPWPDSDPNELPFPAPEIGPGWEKASNQEIYGDETGGPEPQRP